MKRWLLALVLLPACVVLDGGADVTLLPEGPLDTNDAGLVLYIETGARGAAHLWIDGEEDEQERPLNDAFTFDTARLDPGTHRVQARVRDGTQLRDSNVVEVRVSEPSPSP